MRKKCDTLFFGTCAVLLYHRINELETDPQLLSVSTVHFDEHVAYLRKNYNLLTINEFENFLKNKKRFPKNSVIITFDDGYADNYLKAIPVLEKHNAQAIFYIATGTINTTNEYWWDAIERIVLLSSRSPTKSSFELNGTKFNLTNISSSERVKLYEDLLPKLRQMKSFEREEKIAELADIFNSTEGRITHRAMTFEELKKMGKSKSAIIGAHTHLHPSLGALSKQDQYEEIKLSKDILEKLLNKEITHFSYPFGTRADFNANSLNIMQQLNFSFSAANFPSLVNPNSNKLKFPRYLVRDWDIETFEMKMSGFF
ncbi:MAG: polysaccharide deacetylase family protein [Bacteroidia bacterium]